MACFLGKISRGGDDAIIDLLENTCHSCYATRMYQTTDVFLELTCSCPSWSNLILTSIAVDLSSNAHPFFVFLSFTPMVLPRFLITPCSGPGGKIPTDMACRARAASVEPREHLKRPFRVKPPQLVHMFGRHVSEVNAASLSRCHCQKIISSPWIWSALFASWSILGSTWYLRQLAPSHLVFSIAPGA